VRVAGVRRAFGGTLVLDGVDLDVHAGEGVALLGANGSGKTTLLKTIATLQRPSRGSVTVVGADTSRDAEEVRRHLGFVAHGAYVYEDLTALENLRFWSTLSGLRSGPAELMSALTAVELDTFASDRARTFSAGMKRRLSLARFMLTSPRVLLLDEPFTGLDQAGRKWLEEYLLAFKARGGAVLMATHSFRLGFTVADRIVILAGGRIVVDRARVDLTPDELERLYTVHTEDLS
jgi:heme ABC exporter ATP-binding subunit CcmA